MSLFVPDFCLTNVDRCAANERREVTTKISISISEEFRRDKIVRFEKYKNARHTYICS